jgi:anti-sigma regulatory factor (Ser/Thr protein kinase)
MAASGRGPQQDIGALGGPAVPASGLRWRRVFPGDEQQLGVLRRWLESLLPDCSARDDVIYVATELGTNAVQHTASGRSGWFVVEITWHRAVVRVAVADGGATAGPRVVRDPDGEHGRGLLVVAGLSARTGVCGDDRGRLVWADVPWAGATEPTSPLDPHEAAIGDGQAGLASRFTGVPAWFGWSTLQSWALAAGRLVNAPRCRNWPACLAASWTPRHRVLPWTASVGARTTRAVGWEQRPGVPVPQFPRVRAHVPQGGRDGIGLGGHGGPGLPAAAIG